MAASEKDEKMKEAAASRQARAQSPETVCALLWESLTRPPPSPLTRCSMSSQITVTFNADVAEGMPWKFVPTQRQASGARTRLCSPLAPAWNHEFVRPHAPLERASIPSTCQHSCSSAAQVVVRPGESTLAFYTAHNLSDEPIVGVSTYNVTPARAGLYFMKIQCFCFEEQRLLPGEKIDMPVFFYLVRCPR